MHHHVGRQNNISRKLNDGMSTVSSFTVLKYWSHVILSNLTLLKPKWGKNVTMKYISVVMCTCTCYCSKCEHLSVISPAIQVFVIQLMWSRSCKHLAYQEYGVTTCNYPMMMLPNISHYPEYLGNSATNYVNEYAVFNLQSKCSNCLKIDSQSSKLSKTVDATFRSRLYPRHDYIVEKQCHVSFSLLCFFWVIQTP